MGASQEADAKAAAERILESQRRSRERAAEKTAKQAIESAKAKERAAATRRAKVAAAKGDSGPGKCVSSAVQALAAVKTAAAGASVR